MDYETTFTCYKCKGKGEVWIDFDSDGRLRFYDHNPKIHFTPKKPHRCPTCNGEGTLTWVDAILKGLDGSQCLPKP